MATLFWIIIATFSVSLISFVGVFALALKEKLLERILLFLVAFSAGSLIGGAFLHLMPEAVEGAETMDISVLNVFLYLLLGFCVFFILERFIGWHHHHSSKHPEIKSFSYLILASDALHNFIDGLIIAAGFLVDFSVGAITTLMVILHEIPQEVGDFGVLVYGGFNKTKALFLNFLSALVAIFGGIIGYFLSRSMGDSAIFLLSFAAGNFIYIACSDLIPEIKKTETEPKKSFFYFLTFLSGIGLMWIFKVFLE